MIIYGGSVGGKEMNLGRGESGGGGVEERKKGQS